MKRILYVEDDQNLAVAIRSTLTNLQLDVKHFLNGENALAFFPDYQPDLVILDIMLNGELDGFDVAEAIRKQSNTPILFTSSLEEDFHLEKGFRHINSDYIRKPFGIKELKLRINRMLHQDITQHPGRQKYTLGKFTFIPFEQSLLYLNNHIHLSYYENEVLLMLCRHIHQFVSRDNIICDIWQVKEPVLKEPSYYNIITKLRKILQSDPCIKIESCLRSKVRLVVG